MGGIVAQIRAAAHHLLAIAPDLGADPARFTVSGHSAGAHLASYLAAIGPKEAAQPPKLPPIRGLLLVSGIYDLSGIPSSFLKNEAKMREAEAAAWSPLTSLHLPVPKRIVTRGSLETSPFQDHAAALSNMLQSNGQPCILRSEPNLNHLTIVLSLADTKSKLGEILSTLTID
ncbi:alpha/beta hydrolase [Cypionkella sp.]|uniref:alpha/beta hydrolase n=1 Tax=Cypionkella sp. TaxID=2811411 RepID=UPI00261885A3|nr:alpha/beta hydrolase [Cypionkella sp.]